MHRNLWFIFHFTHIFFQNILHVKSLIIFFYVISVQNLSKAFSVKIIFWWVLLKNKQQVCTAAWVFFIPIVKKWIFFQKLKSYSRKTMYINDGCDQACRFCTGSAKTFLLNLDHLVGCFLWFQMLLNKYHISLMEAVVFLRPILSACWIKTKEEICSR